MTPERLARSCERGPSASDWGTSQHHTRHPAKHVKMGSLLTGTTWIYTKVPQAEFNKLQPSELYEIATAFRR